MVLGAIAADFGGNSASAAFAVSVVDGTAPDIAGKNVANPGALVLAGCMLLEHLGEGERGLRVRRALETVIREGKSITRDLGGAASTDEFTDAIIAKL